MIYLCCVSIYATYRRSKRRKTTTPIEHYCVKFHYFTSKFFRLHLLLLLRYFPPSGFCCQTFFSLLSSEKYANKIYCRCIELVMSNLLLLNFNCDNLCLFFTHFRLGKYTKSGEKKSRSRI